MALLTAEQIEQADDRKWEDVPVPEWNGTVRVMALSGEDRDAYETAMVDVKHGSAAQAKLTNFRSKLVAKSLVNEQGERLFSDGKVKVLAAKNAAVINRLWQVTQRLSGMGKSAVAEGKDGSESTPAESSTSD